MTTRGGATGRAPGQATGQAPGQATGQATGGDGEFVLYWMHHAVRGHENPSLDVAIRLARDLGKPLLVYHALCERYPYASDRHHAFILQGARDVQRELRDRGITYAFHLQRDGYRGAHLRDLARRASVVVSDEMPVEPVIGWIGRLMTLCETPLACVDSSCVCPLPLLGKPFTRAYAFREQTAPLFAARLSRPYEDEPRDCEMFRGELPFEPIDLQSADLAELIGRCQIDHSIAPIADTPGGSRAGYARWEAFKRSGLSGYARRRNNAADPAGVSRMSAYLHFGMVSPLRIAREAAAVHAEKYLDELLIWRELAFHFCHHMGERVESLEGIPEWARRTLAEHASDPRPALPSWETLSRAHVGDPLWDACQQSLLRHGELHNNLRMSWGKAILQWANTPERALHLAIDLNHRYALDGRDPSSYGGLLWCFGQFDRPFQPTQPILGEVRPRPIEEHRQRIDLDKFRVHVDRAVAANSPRIAMIGAGIAGLIAARTLTDHGLAVRVFDKSRGVGGRMATKRTDNGLKFDHGAQYFTARDCRFCRYVRSWVEDGIVAPWEGRIVHVHNGKILAEKAQQVRYVALPGMNGLGKHLAEGLDLSLGTTVSQLRSARGGQWQLLDDQGESLGEFDKVIVNTPPPQAIAILQGHTDLCEQIARVEMNPCWAVMLALGSRLRVDFDGAFVESNPLSWVSRESAKPERTGPTADQWVLHASPTWSAAHLEDDPTAVATELVDQFATALGLSRGDRDLLAKPAHVAAHRWRYAIPTRPLDADFLWDPTQGIGACGDWCGGPRIEGAFLSGMAMAGAVLRHWTIDRPATRMLFD